VCCFGQFIIPGEGVMDVKLGADWDQIEWELGFKGEMVEKENEDMAANHVAELTNISYDFIVSYQHLMWLPISELYFKDNKLCMLRLSSYPEYNQMICGDLGTLEGLNFWDNSEKVMGIYGPFDSDNVSGKSYYIYSEKGLALEMTDNEVRAMFIFQPQME